MNDSRSRQKLRLADKRFAPWQENRRKKQTKTIGSRYCCDKSWSVPYYPTDPAHYRWPSYRHNALGSGEARLSAHPLYLALGTDGDKGQQAYRALFRSELDEAARSDIRLALSQDQPLGNEQYKDAVCAASGVRRASAKRGRLAKQADSAGGKEEQADFGS
jgi:putative transposase